MSERKAVQVACPGCGQRTPFTPANPHRPFCSERCRLMDLGAWSAGSYVIAASGDEPSQDDEVKPA